MKKVIITLFLINTLLGFSQQFNKNYYISPEISYRSYGRNDHIGYGGGLEYSKNLKNWLGIGTNISYWANKKKDWDFNNPFTGQNYKYFGVIKDLKISIFSQLFLLNTKHFAPYIQIGGYTGYFYQEYYIGGYATFYNPDEFIINIYDDGFKGIQFGYEIGVGLRFKFNKFFITPSIIKTNKSILFDLDGYDSLSLKIGWNIE